jgi:hypothetical protein
LNIALIRVANKKINTDRTKAKAKGIHKGEVTHHQDQSIWPVSLSPKKRRNRRVFEGDQHF